MDVNAVEDVLTKLEIELEAGSECGCDALFAKLVALQAVEVEEGVTPNDEVEPEWLKAVPGLSPRLNAMFGKCLGDYGLYRMSDAYLNRSVESYAKAASVFWPSRDTSRAIRCTGRLFRAAAFASFSAGQLNELVEPYVEELFASENVTQEISDDQREAWRSISEMGLRILGENPFNQSDDAMEMLDWVAKATAELLKDPNNTFGSEALATRAFLLIACAKQPWIGILGAPNQRNQQLELAEQDLRKAISGYTGDFYSVGANGLSKEHRRRGFQARSWGWLALVQSERQAHSEALESLKRQHALLDSDNSTGLFECFAAQGAALLELGRKDDWETLARDSLTHLQQLESDGMAFLVIDSVKRLHEQANSLNAAELSLLFAEIIDREG